MPRLSIELSEQEHQQLKVSAALNGQSLKAYVLSRALVDIPDPAGMTDEQALGVLKRLLAPRLADAKAGRTVALSAEDTKRAARAGAETRRKPTQE